MAPRTFDLPPQYDPRSVEGRWYRTWTERGVFAPAPTGEPYVIVIPPPNVTGVLHMGHGLNNTIQDVLIRFERMRGRAAEWLPGTDHAGIATQNVVERLVAKEGKTRFDLGRDAFVARVWEFVRKTGDTILEQLRQIGASCDWSRTRFTLDEAYSRAVREVFVTLWEQQLIYRGHRVIHWCPRCLTALSDEEAEFRETSGNLYYIRYPLADGSGHVTVATTRPETLLGDTAIVVHPEDPRGAPYIGKRVRLPITGIEIPVLGDESVDKEFGTGFVKVTPAHDVNDFEIGVRHKLAMPLIMRENGTLGDDGGDRQGETVAGVPPDLIGVDRFEARKKIVKQLEAAGLLAKVETHQHAVRRCYRCDSIVEPRLSDQWFVKMKPLAEPVLDAYRKGEYAIVPERWNATFLNWMENIRDWNISRQLWWGHRIPVFTCTKCQYRFASRTDPTTCPECDGHAPVEQDPDVLDTWFSSWLWPFATFGWPERTPDLARFYPGHTLVTAPEILFFWVARMMMAGHHFMGRKPFTTVYLTGTARDTQHRRMSKSLGNGIDPLDVVNLFGADALRWTLVGGGSLGADVILDPNDLETTFAPGRNFANKLWNIGRFILSQLPDDLPSLDAIKASSLTRPDRWILSRLQATIGDATAAYEQFRLDEGAKRCYAFTWDELADWYVEITKLHADSATSQAVLAHCFDQTLRLLHPVVPFITEELWQRLPGRKAGELLAQARWPSVDERRIDIVAEAEFGSAMEVISGSRTIRSENQVPPKTKTNLWVISASPQIRKVLEAESALILATSGSATLNFGEAPQEAGGTKALSSGIGVFVSLKGIDVSAECRRLNNEVSRLDKQLESLAAKLGNAQFVSRAPADVVAREREKEKVWRDQRDVLTAKLTALGCG